MWVDGFNYHYYAGRKSEGGRETYASVVVSENNREITAQLTVAELGTIEQPPLLDGRNMVRELFEKARPDAVINLAAESHVDRSIDAAADFIHTNIDGT